MLMVRLLLVSARMLVDKEGVAVPMPCSKLRKREGVPLVDEKALDAWLASNNDSEGSFFVMGVISGTGELKFAIVEDDDSIVDSSELRNLMLGS